MKSDKIRNKIVIINGYHKHAIGCHHIYVQIMSVCR